MAQALIAFDYEVFGEHANTAIDAEAQINEVLQAGGKGVLVIGEQLQRVKDIAKHGTFMKWVESRFGMPYKKCQRYMRISSRLGKVVNIDHFDYSSLMLLAQDTTPDEAIDEAVKQAQQSQKITNAVAKEIVAKHKPDTIPMKRAVPAHAELVIDEPEDEDQAAVQSILAGTAKRPSPTKFEAKPEKDRGEMMSEVYSKCLRFAESLDEKYPNQKGLILYCLEKLVREYA